MRSRFPWLPMFWSALCIAVLVPIWSVRTLPILDLPVHLALVRGWHSMADPRFAIAAHYALRIRPSPYLLHYALVDVAMFAFKIETASKLVLSLYVLSFPLSLAMCARSLGRTPVLGLAGFVLVFNPCWAYGYLSYLLSTSAFLFSLAALFSWLARGRRATLIGFGLGSLLTYFGHVLTWGFLAIAVVALAAAEGWVRRSPLESRATYRRHGAAVAALAPSCMLALFTFWDERRAHAYVADSVPFRGTWRTPLQAVAEFPRRAIDIFPGHADTGVFFVAIALLVGLLVHHGSGGARRPLTVLAVGLCLWLTLPYEISHPVIFFQISGRLPPLLTALAFVLPNVRSSEKMMVPASVLATSSLVVFVWLAILSRDFDRRNRSFFDLIDPLPDGSTTMVVVRHMMRGEHPEEESGDPATSAPAYWGFAEWPMALHGGYGPYVFDQGVPIVLKKKLAHPAFPPPDDLVPPDAPDFDYYVIRDPSDMQLADSRWRMVRRIGDWVLFANRRREERGDVQ